MSGSLRVVIADDQALVRSGFGMILTADGIEVAAEAANGAQAVAAVRRTAPDVVLMDIRMPEMDGIEATRRIVAADTRGTRVLILTTYDLDQYVYAALTAGASGFLLKDVTPEQLVAAVRVVRAGNALLAPAITRRLVERFTRPDEAIHRDLSDLTPRELEVLRLMATGLSNAELGGRRPARMFRFPVIWQHGGWWRRTEWIRSSPSSSAAPARSPVISTTSSPTWPTPAPPRTPSAPTAATSSPSLPTTARRSAN